MVYAASFDLEFGVRTSGLIAGGIWRADTGTTGITRLTTGLRLRVSGHGWCAGGGASRWPDRWFYVCRFWGGGWDGRCCWLQNTRFVRRWCGATSHAGSDWRERMRRFAGGGRARAPIRMVCGMRWSSGCRDGPCVAFLFNPFGAPVLRRLLKALATSFAGRPGQERQLDILYVNNEHESVLERQTGFRRLFQGEVRRSRADATADHKILATSRKGNML